MPLSNLFTGTNQGIQYSNEFVTSLNRDITAIENFRSALTNGDSRELAFAEHLRNASEAARTWANNTANLTRPISEFATQQRQFEVSLTATDKTFANVRRLINTYNEGLGTANNTIESVGLSQHQFTESVKESNTTLGNYLGHLDGSKASMAGYAVQLAGARLKTIGLTVATTALNAAISFGVSLLIQTVITAISDAIHWEDRLIENSEKAKSKISELNDEISGKKQTVTDNASRFAELYQDVGDFGRSQGDLSNEEYQEFLDISNQLAETFPTLSRTYDENGNAIVSLSGSVEEITTALNELLEAETQLANLEIKDQLNDLFSGLKVQSQKDDIDAFSNYLASFSEGNTGRINYDRIEFSEQHNRVADRVSQRLSSEGIGNTLTKDLNGNWIVKLFEASPENMARVRSIYQDEITDIANDLAVMTGEESRLWSGILKPLTSALESEGAYVMLSDDIKNVVLKSMNNLDFSQFDNVDAIIDYLVGDNGLSSKIKKASPEVQESIVALFNETFDGKTVEYALNGFQEEIDKAEKALEMDEGELSKLIGIDSDSIKTTFNNIKRSIQGVTDEDLLGMDIPTLNRAWNYVENYGVKTWTELQEYLDRNPIELKVDYESVTKRMEAVTTALTESASATGLTSESMEALTNKYKRYEEVGLDAEKLFFKTSAGIKVNAQELSRLEGEYEKIERQNIDDKINDLIREYDILTKKISETNDEAERQKLIDTRDEIQKEINSVSELASQYDGLTSAFKQWVDAQSSGELGDTYDAYITGYKELKELFENGLIGTNEFRAGVQALSGQDLSGKSAKEISNAYEQLSKTISGTDFSAIDFLSEDATGVDNLVRALYQLDQGFVDYDSDADSYVVHINDMQKAADALGISIDFLNATLLKGRDYGNDIQIQSNVEVDDSEVEDLMNKDTDKDSVVTWTNNLSEVNRFLNTPLNKAGTINWMNQYGQVSSYGGTGVTGNTTGSIRTRMTMASGSGGALPYSGEALVGELGTESVVRDGRWFLIGQNGAQLFKYKKGDIVFNANQTKAILRNGKISSRGLALADGTGAGGATWGSIRISTKKKRVGNVLQLLQQQRAESGGGYTRTGVFGEGVAYQNAVRAGYNLYGSYSTSNNKTTTVLSGASGSGGSGGGGSSSSSSSNTDPNVLDWIEVAIERIEQAINRVKEIATSTFKTLGKRMSATYSQIDQINKEIEVQQKGYARYMKEADSVGLSADLKTKVQQGAIDITEYDEETKKLIDTYKQWYDKAIDCSDAVQTLHLSLAELYQDNFENIQKDYDNQLSLLEHQTAVYENGISALEAKGYLESAKYYASLSDVEKRNVSIMQKELADLENSFSEAMNSGEIDKYSEAWYEMQNSINEVKQNIDEANISLLEYAKTMREIEWGYFDFVQERIGQLTQESDFLIDLMENSKLFDDQGGFSQNGLATLGLRAQNYNVYMSQADQYFKEMQNIEKQMASDKYNTELLERREELLKLQQESISSAEEEKQAIVSLVEEGIKIELDNLKELIDTYKDSLDSAKDLYSYQKKVNEQTKEIASLRKQLSAYSGDTSEENRARIQKLTVELSDAEEALRETEYDQWVSDTEKMLDDLYDEYEMIVNERLDNVEALMVDMISTVNNNSSTIDTTLKQVSSDVGYQMTSEMRNVWASGGNANAIVAKYGDDFSSKLTSVNATLATIQAHVSSLVSASNKEALSTSSKATSTTTPKTTTTASTANTVKNATTVATKTATATVAKAITVGGKIKASASTKIYAHKNGTGVHQYFDDDPIYTVLAKDGQWLQVRWHKLSSGTTGYFKESDVKAYKTGGLIDYTGLAQVDGSRRKPELVLNARDSENFIALKNVLRDVSVSHATGSFGSSINNGLRSMGTSVGEINISIPIEHVEDYNDFVTQLKNDKQFEKMIQSITVDRIAGGSALAKNKYKW